MMRVAVIGAGLAGRSHLFDLVSDPRFDVRGVCARTISTAKEAADLFGLPHAWDDPAHALRTPGLDGVIVAVPPQPTPQLIRECLTAGKLTLADKPAARTATDLQSLLDELGDATKNLRVGYNRRYLFHLRRLQAAVPGVIDAPCTVTCRWTSPFSSRYTDASTYRSGAGFGDGVVLDTASHIFDTLLWLGMQDLKILTAHLEQGTSGADIAAEIALTAHNGTRITVSISNGPVDDHWEITLTTDNKVITADATAVEERGTDNPLNTPPPSEVELRPVHDLLAMANGAATSGATITEAIAALTLVDQTRHRAAQPGWRRPRAKALGRRNGSC